VRRLDPAWELAPTVVGRRLGLTIRLGGGAEVPDTATEKEADEAAVLRETEPPETEKQETIAGPGFVERLRSQLSLARALVRPLLRMIAALPSTLRLRQLRLSAVVGLDDAEATGRLYGIVQAITPAVPGRVCLSVTPDFTAAGVRGRGEARLHLYLGRLLVIVTRFGLTAARVWLAARLRAWWATRRRPVVS
jgi:hypothetical protein